MRLTACCLAVSLWLFLSPPSWAVVSVGQRYKVNNHCVTVTKVIDGQAHYEWREGNRRGWGNLPASHLSVLCGSTRGITPTRVAPRHGVNRTVRIGEHYLIRGSCATITGVNGDRVLYARRVGRTRFTGQMHLGALGPACQSPVTQQVPRATIRVGQHYRIGQTCNTITQISGNTVRYTRKGKGCLVVKGTAMVRQLGQPCVPPVQQPGKTVQPQQPQNQPSPGNVKLSSSEINSMVSGHNSVRRQVGVGPVTWSAALASYAQVWADVLKKTRNCGLQHRPRQGQYTQKYGENIAWWTGNRPVSFAVTSWASEKQQYVHGPFGSTPGVGHYTQIVWRSSTKIGCARQLCGNATVVVCNYDPPGNWMGRTPY